MSAKLEHKKILYSTDCAVLMHITLGRADFDMWIWGELFTDLRRLMHTADGL